MTAELWCGFCRQHRACCLDHAIVRMATGWSETVRVPICRRCCTFTLAERDDIATILSRRRMRWMRCGKK